MGYRLAVAHPRAPQVIRRRSLQDPDEARRFPHGTGQLVRLGAVEVGRAVLEPGWRWSRDVKPIMGTPSCQIHHFHVVLAGRFAVQMDGGTVEEFAADDIVDVPPGHDAWVVGDEPAVILDIAGNVSEFGVPASQARAVVTMLMSDIVGSTDIASRVGEMAWKRLLAEHNRLVRRNLERFRGHEVDTTGDGFLASFDSAGAALRCALAIASEMPTIDLQVRIGVHTGEVEVGPDGIHGIAVHATARVMAAAAPSEVLASAVTRTLAEGVGLSFESRGPHRLKGLQQPLELFAVREEVHANGLPDG